MIKLLYKRRRFTALFLVTIMVIQMALPTVTYALTSGPAQPETQAFQPAGTTDMVDLFSGDFSYNIPLFELPGPNGGYPFNLSYQSNIGMDQESTWVGLGFSLNPGAINRQMRGLPDEFKGDEIFTKTSISPSVTVGLGAGVSIELAGADNLSLGVGFSVNQNSYKGLGYSIDGSVGYQAAVSSGMTAGIGLNFSLGSKDGVGANANASLGLGEKVGDYGINAGYNSKTGLSSVSVSHDLMRYSHTYEGRKGKEKTWSNTISESTEISLANTGYTPQVSMPMRNLSLSAKFKAGAAWWLIFGSPYVTGFYNEQWLKNDKKRVKSKGFGYMNYQYAANKADVLDFNREKDGMVMKESPNLSMPSLTYDIYSVCGQGISTMYRPMRNDYGIIRDPETSSISVGGSVGVDVGPASSHIGVNLSVSHSKSTSGTWSNDDNNEMDGHAGFVGKAKDSEFEPWYFKAHGEPTSESEAEINGLGGNDPVQVMLTGERPSPKASNWIKMKKNKWSNDITKQKLPQERKQRNQVIQTITNDELMNEALTDDKNTLVSFFKVRYINESDKELPYDRIIHTQEHRGHHVAGLTALTPEGLRYNYGIPAYNLHQEEVTFTAHKKSGQVSKVDVDNTDKDDPKYAHDYTEKFLKRVEMPPYAHSYLLTSVVGPDYVDVSGDGVTADDLGYWVKFTYKRTSGKTAPYKWRDPYAQAHFQEGWRTDPRDDKGSFVYGEKELWYLAKAETKSHISTFAVEAREDGRGVKHKMRDADNRDLTSGGTVYALKEIKLLARGQSNPIKVVKFEYDYSLCPKVYNSSTSKGKLTLKKLWFEYGKSTKGRLNPYVFGYDETNNPNYDQLAYDRWGNYKPYDPAKAERNKDFPYVDQNLSKESMDRQAAAWSLNSIQLPSGGKIMVDYESDDYGYVQHLPAMQMMEIVDPASDSPYGAKFNINDSNLKVRFKLEKPIADVSGINKPSEVLKYLDQRRKQVYFKILVNLRSSDENFHEYICGYADIDMDPNKMTLEKDGSNGAFVYGTFYLKSEDKHHPFSMRAWQHLRSNQPDLANSGRKLKQTNDTNERVKQIRSLGNVFSQIKEVYKGFYAFCSKKGWGRELVAGKSWIRLNSPDKIKYGGGLRVRQITMQDNWKDNNQDEDEEGMYGQVYEYVTKEGGVDISSGVAAYEPLVGGDEIPLRYAKKYTQAIALRSNNNLFFEYPINESYFPGPQVGYSKVTVTSLPAASLAGKLVNHATFPKRTDTNNISYGTTGITEHEFYTAKDFPVITDETEKANMPFKLSVPIPFLGSVAVSKLTTSQGYSIITNDMHGKVKQVSNYRQTEQGTPEATAISWVKYNYLSKPRKYQQVEVSELSAHFKDENNNGMLRVVSESTSDSYTIGQEKEFFFDMRQYEDKTWGGGVNINIDIAWLAFYPVIYPSFWPNVSKSVQQLRMAVANKIIFKSGILESVEAYDGGSKITTKNIKWDKLTGAVVVTQVTNNFDKDIFSYTIPAYTKYQGMGAAYKNIGLTFSIASVKKTAFKNNLYTFTTPALTKDLLFPGDEILLYDNTTTMTKPLAKVIYNGDEADAKILYSEEALAATEYQGMIVRSGYRNQLSVSAGSVTALKDPSVKGATKEYSKNVSVPKVKTGN